MRFTTVLTVVSGGLFLDQKNFECRGLGAQRRRFLIRYDVEKIENHILFTSQILEKCVIYL